MKKQIVSLVLATSILFPTGMVLAAEAPTVTLKWIPRVDVSLDGTTASATLRIKTDQRTDMSVMVCEGEELSGDIDECDWQVMTAFRYGHFIVIENLKPDTVYTYRAQFVNLEGLGTTTEDTFLTIE